MNQKAKTPQDSIEQVLARVEQSVATLRKSLPNMVDVGSLGVISKAPYKLLIVRESLIYRTEELARSALLLWKSEDTVASAILVRCIMESVALQHKLYSLLEGRHLMTAISMDETLRRLLMGFKNDKAFPSAINILALIDQLAKKIPPFRSIYDNLSEIAHPNYTGVAHLYTQRGHDQFNMRIIKNQDRLTHVRQSTLRGMDASLRLFIGEYDAITGLVENWLTELEKF